MKLAIGLFGFALCSSMTTVGQIVPNGGCGCRVGSSSTVSCSCPEAVPINAGSSTSKQTVGEGRRELDVYRIVLSPGGVLTRWVPGEDVLILGKGTGELVNEAKSPPVSLSMSDGQIVLMPKEEPFALRNTGKQDVEILLIRLPPTSPANQ